MAEMAAEAVEEEEIPKVTEKVIVAIQKEFRITTKIKSLTDDDQPTDNSGRINHYHGEHLDVIRELEDKYSEEHGEEYGSKAVRMAVGSTQVFDCPELFGLKAGDISGYKEPGHVTPEIDDAFVFNTHITKQILAGIALRKDMLLVGHAGTGKTSICNQIATRINYNCEIIPLDAHMSRLDLVGQWILKGKETVFIDGLLIKAMQTEGTIIVLDEFDCMDEQLEPVFRSLMDDRREIVITEDGGRRVKMHEDNIIIATANTVGRGDNTGLYGQGTNVLNWAGLDRFDLVVRVEYLSEDEEVALLQKQEEFANLRTDEARALVKVGNKIRSAFEKGTLQITFSPRPLMNCAEFYLAGFSIHDAFAMAFSNKTNSADGRVISEILEHIFGPKDGDA